MMPVENWTPGVVIKATRAEMVPRVSRAIQVVQSAVDKRIKVGARSPDGGPAVVRSKKTGRQYARSPADPAPTPPRSISNRLRNSLTSKVTQEPTAIVGTVGVHTPYGLRLEKGFFKTDSKGRNFNQQPRPYLVPSLEENLRTILGILKGEL